MNNYLKEFKEAMDNYNWTEAERIFTQVCKEAKIGEEDNNKDGETGKRIAEEKNKRDRGERKI